MQVDFETLLQIIPHISFAGDCWLWQLSKDKDGYGDWRAASERKVHRLMWEIHHGKILETLEIDHCCTNRHCCNPLHLDVVTHAENMRRIRSRRTHCKRGHAVAEHTYVSSKGQHMCRKCCSIRARERYQANPIAGAARRKHSRLQKKAREEEAT